ncbi:MAG: diguanylate cyclase [Desulfocapsaceae bacterium]|nr:diguanylate cyclase [Desulfocapsaceae bacterium]
MDSTQALKAIGSCLALAMERGLGKNGLVFPVECKDAADDTCRNFCKNLEQIFAQMNETYRFAEALANGELKTEVSRSNIFAMPLKALQASLRHLTWQTNQVADGDLSQQVDFLGEFSLSFNHMIASLRDKESLEQRLKTITDVLGEGVYLVDTEGRLIFANPEAERLLGYSFQEMAGKMVFNTIHKQFADGTFFPPEGTQLVSAIHNGQVYNNDDCVFACKSGRLMPVSLACRPVITGGKLEGTVIAFHDITEQKKYQESLQTINALLEKQASTDALTGIYNRLEFSKLLTLEISRARRYQSSMTIIMFDIDKFKEINDAYGHQTGDSVLIDMARVVNANVRTTDIFARWGGEEFMVIAPGCALDQGIQLAEMLRLRVAQTTFSVPREVTASFGVAALRRDDTEISLTNRVDHALYQAKANGRNRVEAEDADA